MWFVGPSTNLLAVGNVIRDMTADGINIAGGASQALVTQNSIRNTGDDGIALWSRGAPNVNCSVIGNTIQMPVIANGIAVYGGNGNRVTSNIIMDTIASGGGIFVGNYHSPVPLTGVTVISQNSLWRCGAALSEVGGVPTACGAVWIGATDDSGGELTFNNGGALVFSDLEIKQPQYSSILIWGGKIRSSSFSDIVISESSRIIVQLGAVGSINLQGSVSFRNVTVATISSTPSLLGCPSKFLLDDGGSNSWLKACNLSLNSSCLQPQTCSGSFCSTCLPHWNDLPPWRTYAPLKPPSAASVSAEFRMSGSWSLWFAVMTFYL